LEPARGGVFVDATVGMGGHSDAILSASCRSRVVGIDQDLDAIDMAKQRLARYGDRVTLVQANFRDIRSVVKDFDTQPAGILADIGVSSYQIDTPDRGFSFASDGPLDMRMDRSSERQTAAELIATASEEQLADIIYHFGEERYARRVARRLVQHREAGAPLETTRQLAELVRGAVPRSKKEKIDPATRTFQALRIAVNDELEVLNTFISDSIDVLAPGGRLAIISFHSLEDRIVKKAFNKFSGRCECPPRLPICVCGAIRKAEILTRKPVIASESEALKNPRARSAKLRACRKLEI
jgi:16S rRNA (cytosine1402-N4)-methyltransferase